MTDQTLRKDAARNRQLLIAAGRDLFARRGLAATLNDVAHHAGVGVGTAYRRFANKEELIEAIWHEQVDELETVLREALAASDPWEGLVLYLERSLAAQSRDRGMAQMLAGRTWPDHYDQQRDRLAPLVDQVAARAREAGVLREDVTGTDLIFLQIALTDISGTVQDGTVPEGRGDADQLYRRYLWIVLDGLRASASGPTELPVAALSTYETHTLLQPRNQG
ncbi:TetR family transcriptional regulator [Pseudarthrobacter oxydans]|jgi:AcrR family transcriptional regulator|uniref:TetR/AcrR family transcriptional regulator n=1 Tax=Pseudarthrobacter oxydans TaxID=1671 RepID=UPI002AA73E4A|nr:TetR family transcriptional regulator [Pseudarthrobacter oxydans]WPU09489.1 TetR family transcriptional regulator [Pseudarthrobacter oxydans]